jgi:acyl carrier protein phosphodiesterase
MVAIHMRRMLDVLTDARVPRAVTCIRCRLTIRYGESAAGVVSDVLASHWADDHHLAGWRDAAAEARDRLWRRNPDLLEKLASLSDGSTGVHGRTG